MGKRLDLSESQNISLEKAIKNMVDKYQAIHSSKDPYGILSEEFASPDPSKEKIIFLIEEKTRRHRELMTYAVEQYFIFYNTLNEDQKEKWRQDVKKISK